MKKLLHISKLLNQTNMKEKASTCKQNNSQSKFKKIKRDSGHC